MFCLLLVHFCVFKVATALIYLMRHTWASHLSVMQSSGNATKAASTSVLAFFSSPLVVADCWNNFSTALFLKPSCSFVVHLGAQLFAILFYLHFLFFVLFFFFKSGCYLFVLLFKRFIIMTTLVI